MRGFRIRLDCQSLLANSFPALKRATFLAFIVISSFVCGLRPFLAFLFEIKKVPNPTNVTFPPPFKVLVTASVKESIAAFAWVLVMPVSSAILLIKSALFMLIFLNGDNGDKFRRFYVAAKFFLSFFHNNKITPKPHWERILRNFIFCNVSVFRRLFYHLH